MVLKFIDLTTTPISYDDPPNTDQVDLSTACSETDFCRNVAMHDLKTTHVSLFKGAPLHNANI